MRHRLCWDYIPALHCPRLFRKKQLMRHRWNYGLFRVQHRPRLLLFLYPSDKFDCPVDLPHPLPQSARPRSRRRSVLAYRNNSTGRYWGSRRSPACCIDIVRCGKSVCSPGAWRPCFASPSPAPPGCRGHTAVPSAEQTALRSLRPLGKAHLRSVAPPLPR